MRQLNQHDFNTIIISQKTLRLIHTMEYVFSVALYFIHQRFRIDMEAKVELTQREKEILILLAEGKLTEKEIADKLSISPHTVRFHISNMFDKYGVHKDRELINKARADETSNKILLRQYLQKSIAVLFDSCNF
jgi:DNA-binding CsgD family transcriptional regulator